MNKPIRNGHSLFAHQQSRLQVFGYRVAGLLFLVILVCLFGASAALAQNLTGEIDGVVKDSSGAVIPNATVTVTDKDQGQVVRTLKSNVRGEFTAPLLAIGNYSVTVTASGFETTTANLEVHVNLPVSLGVSLKPGSETQTIQVDASGSGLQLDTAAAGTLISNTQMTQLSLSSRNFLQLLYLQPGVSGGIPGPDTRGNISTSGRTSCGGSTGYSDRCQSG